MLLYARQKFPEVTNTHTYTHTYTHTHTHTTHTHTHTHTYTHVCTTHVRVCVCTRHTGKGHYILAFESFGLYLSESVTKY